MTDVLLGIQDAFTLANMIVIFAGVTLGIIVGAIPGLNAPMAIAIAVPLTYYMSPLSALAFLISVNKGGSFGGSISGILLNTPGSPEAAATAIDGYPLARKGKPVKAMQTALGASVCGDLFSDIVLILVAAPLAIVALKLGPVETCALIVFAFAMIAGLLGNSIAKGLIATALGVFFATVGTDPTLSMPRLTFNSIDLQSGIPLMAIGIGMLALSEVLLQIEEYFRGQRGTKPAVAKIESDKDDRLTIREFFGLGRTIFRSAVIGTAIGALPGLGATIAGFLGYGAARRASRNPDQFGKGTPEGIAAAEAANSAVVGSNLIPLLALGIPGNVAGSMTADVILPEMVTFGLRQELSPALTLYGTVEWSNWSRIDHSVLITNQSGGSNDLLSIAYEDGWFVSAGLEYNYSPRTTLRFGAGWEKSPISDEHRTVMLPDNDRVWVSAGASYKFSEKMTLDLAYSHIFVEDAPITTGSYLTAEGDTSLDIVSVGFKYKMGDSTPELEPLK